MYKDDKSDYDELKNAATSMSIDFGLSNADKD
jgi:hypothetical protein